MAGTAVKQLGVTGFVDGGGSWEMGNITFSGDTTTGVPGIVTNPTSQTVAAGYPVTFTATAYSESVPTVTWQYSTNGVSWTTVTAGTVTPTGGTFTASANNDYTSTYSFVTDSNQDQNGYQYRAVFANGAGSTDSSGGTLTVVTPLAPYAIIQPTNQSVQEGDQTLFTVYPGGSPTPTIQWQVSTDNGATFTALTDSAGSVNGSATDSLTVQTTNSLSQNGYEYRAYLQSSAGSTYSTVVTMTVLPTESVLTAWDFSQPQYATAISSDSFQQSPAPVTAGSTIAAANGATTLDLGGTATPLGMNLPYNPADPASGTAPPGAVDAEDIANSSGDVIGTFGGENTWRIRSGINSSPSTAGAPANGWSNYVQPYTQGGEFSVPTTGYQNVYVTLDWFSTHSGEQDAQRQYSLDGGTTWQNLGPQIQLLAPGK